jgi:phosphoribosylformylglycinamidine synthase subunit PurQ / glutaminase
MTALVVTGFGLNCEEETAHAYQRSGLDARIVHASDLFSGKVSLSSASIVHLSGGFSFGDDLGSGRVFANRLRMQKLPSGSTVLRELAAFTKDGGLVYGVCNGFQILVKSGFLPNLGGDFAPEVTLTHNDSGHFEDRWVTCGATESPSPAFRGQKAYALPARHGEGKLVARDTDVTRAIVEQRLVALTYLDASFAPTQTYPDNPNGSELSCAGLTDPTGRVLGTMPHPEAHLLPQLHPAWAKRARDAERDTALPEAGDGLFVFRNLVAAARESGRTKKEVSP